MELTVIRYASYKNKMKTDIGEDLKVEAVNLRDGSEEGVTGILIHIGNTDRPIKLSPKTALKLSNYILRNVTKDNES